MLFKSIGIMAFAETEEQKYKVIKSEKEFEIRYYPSATLATVYSSAKSSKELSGTGFRKLAGYIFGDNNTDTRISMTSPVYMDISKPGSAMSFVKPSSNNRDNLPEPDKKNIKIEKS